VARTTRLIRLAFLIGLLSIASALGPAKAGHYDRASVLGPAKAGHYDRMTVRHTSDRQGTQTHAPSNTPSDGVWEAATRAAITSGSSFRIRTEHVRVASFACHAALVTVPAARARNLADVVHDRSPQHSVPLLI
jgi:hypothetical protein